MFEKKKVAFKNKQIFGNFKNNINACFCKVTKMMLSEKINVDGTINITKAADMALEELWSYVYYLYFYNKDHLSVFKSMIDPDTGKATAIRFYESVIAFTNIRNSQTSATPAKPFNSVLLSEFINKVLAEYNIKVINPVFDYLHRIMERKITFSGLTLRTGDNKGNVSLLTKADNVKNADIKITLNHEKNT